MRPHVDFIDTNEVPEKSLRPGSYSRVLSRDPDTTARTALIRVVPSEGHVDQPRAHCHETSEEIFVVSGRVAFDSRCWLHAGGYIYHPPRWVHGFKSNVATETVMLSRIGGDLTFAFFEETRDNFPYLEGDALSDREAVVVASPWSQRWTAAPSAAGTIKEFVYSADPASTERSTLRGYAAGALDPEPASPTLDRCEEFYIHEGVVEDESGARYTPGFYACLLPGSRRPRLRCIEDALIYHCVAAA
jgi:hypothetical protein